MVKNGIVLLVMAKLFQLEYKLQSSLCLIDPCCYTMKTLKIYHNFHNKYPLGVKNGIQRCVFNIQNVT